MSLLVHRGGELYVDSVCSSGRRLPQAPGYNGPVPPNAPLNGYGGPVNPPPNSAMLPRLPSLNGAYVSDPRPGSAGTRPGSSESASRAPFAMPVPETSEAYSWRQTDPRRPPPGAQPPRVPGYNSVYEDERPPSSPSTVDMPDAYQDYRPYSQQSSSSLAAAPPLAHSQSCTCAHVSCDVLSNSCPRYSRRDGGRAFYFRQLYRVVCLSEWSGPSFVLYHQYHTYYYVLELPGQRYRHPA